MKDEQNSLGEGNGFNPDGYRPERADGVELFDRGEDEESKRYVLLNEKTGTTLQISVRDKVLWDQFDGSATVSEIASKHLQHQHTLVLTRVFTLLQLLWQRKMLKTDPRFAQTEQPKGMRFRLTQLGGFAIPGMRTMMRLNGKLFRLLRFDSSPMIAIFLVLAAVGMYRFDWRLLNEFPLFKLSSTYNIYRSTSSALDWRVERVVNHVDEVTRAPADGWAHVLTLPNNVEFGILLLLIIHLACSFVREFFRGSVTASFIGRAPPLRLVFNYGLPAFHTPSYMRLGLPFGKRTVAACSGLALELALAAVCLLCIGHFGTPLADEILTKVAMILFCRSFFHFSPSAASDVHRIMGDWGDLPDFRKRALGFLRIGLLDAIFGDRVMSREQRFFLTYNVVCVVWLVMAGWFGLSLLETNRQILQNMVSHQTHGTAAAVVFAFVTLPIFISFLASLGWAAYVLYRWISSQSFMRKPGNIILTVWGLVVLFALFIFTMEQLNQYAPPVMYGLIVYANMFLCLTASLFIVRTLPKERHGYTKIKLWMILLVLLQGLLYEITNRIHPNTEIGTIYLWGMVFIFLVYISYIIFKERHFLAYWRTRYSLPEFSILIGIIIFQLSTFLRIAGLTFGGDFPEYPAFSFVSYSLIVAGMLAWVCGMHRVRLFCPALAVDPSHGEMRGLISIGNYLMHRIGQISLDHFGRRAVRRIEKEMGDKVPGRQFSFDEPFFPSQIDVKEVGLLYQEMLESLYETLMIRYSQQFSESALMTAFGKIHWRGKVLMDKFILVNTQWEGRFEEETKLSTEDRRDLLRKYSIFHELADRQLDELADNMMLKTFEKGDVIIQQGTQGDSCFLMVSGQVQVQERDISGAELILAVMSRGDFFGEAALLKNVRRSASIIATSKVSVLRLHKYDFEKIARRYPEMGDTIRDRLQSLHLVINIPLFSDLPANLLRGILPRVQHVTRKKGTVLIHQGDKGDSFYLLKAGKVSVYQEMGDEVTELRTLNKGEYFGEIALLQNIPRTASVRCEEDCELLMIDSRDFRRLIMGSRLFASNLEATGEDRLKN